MGRNGERVAFEKSSWKLNLDIREFDNPWLCPICKKERYPSYKDLKKHKIEVHSY